MSQVLSLLERLNMEPSSQHTKPSFILLSAALQAGQRGMVADSDKLFAKAIYLTQQESNRGNDYATMLVRFADMCADHGRLEKAESLYKEALEIFEKSRGTDHLSAALLMRNLAEICDKLGNAIESRSWSCRASEILNKHRYA